MRVTLIVFLIETLPVEFQSGHWPIIELFIKPTIVPEGVAYELGSRMLLLRDNSQIATK